MIGTRYHNADTYREVIERGTFKPRLHPCTVDGTVDGEPVLLTREQIAEKYRDQGPYIFSAQMLLSPTAAGNQGFQQAWLRRWEPKNTSNLNRYIVVDPAHSKKKGSDYTVIWVIGLGQDQNYYLIDGIRDRLNLAERTQALFDMHRKYRPIAVGYERYGAQADIQHIEERMGQINYRFPIIEMGGQVPKIDRIKGLVPIFAAGRMYLPAALNKVTTEGEVRNIIEDFISQEYLPFPVPVHDDGLDCLARILDPDLKASFPQSERYDNHDPEPEETY
jgi:predicted phage terminase large subunit-like protein